jgi:hypothetical protein
MSISEQLSIFAECGDAPADHVGPYLFTPDSRLEDPEWDEVSTPEVILEHCFGERPTVGDLRLLLAALPPDVPVYINGEGRLTAVELIDPTGSPPFRHIVPEVHVVIG